MDKKLTNKVALVTGGGTGIGKSIAEIFLRNGAKVVVMNINDGKIKKEKGIDYLELDVSIENNWRKVIKYIQKKYKKLDILVNNAGINGFEYNQTPENMTLESWKYIHKINLTSIFLGCKYAIMLMKDNKANCSIINMASRSGMIGVPNLAAYASSKAAIRNYTKSVALYCAQKEYNIRCNTISAAAIDTGMWDHIKNNKAQFITYTKSLPLKRMGSTKEVAYAALYLVSNESLYTTASEMIIDGGILSAGIGLPK